MKRPPQRIQPSGNRRQAPTAQRQRFHVIRRVLRNALHRLQAPDNLDTRRGLFAGRRDNPPIELIDLRDVAAHRLQRRRRQLTVLDTGPLSLEPLWQIDCQHGRGVFEKPWKAWLLAIILGGHGIACGKQCPIKRQVILK